MYNQMYALYIVLIQLYFNFHYNECVKKNFNYSTLQFDQCIINYY